MKIAYVFKSNMASTFQLNTDITPVRGEYPLSRCLGMFSLMTISCVFKKVIHLVTFSKNCKRKKNAFDGL